MSSRRNFHAFIHKLRSHPWLKKAWIIYLGEGNTGDTSASHATILQTFERTHSVRGSDKRPDAGVYTDKYKKNDYKVALQKALSHDQVVFLNDFVVLDEHNPELRRTTLSSQLTNQFDRARPICAKNNKDMAPSYWGWSAKLDERGNFDETANDDILLGLGIAVYWAERFLMGTIDTVNYEQFTWE